MTIQELHEHLVQSHRDVDPILTAVLERGGRRRRRRRSLASAALAAVVVATLGIGIISLNPGSQTRVRTAAGTREPAASTTTGSSDQIDQMPVVGQSPEHLDDGLPKQDRLGSGSLERLDGTSDYAKSIASVLGLKKTDLRRQVLPVEGGTPIVFDTVNVFSGEKGYQASIYHGTPAVFIREHESAGFPTAETPVGTAWYNLPSKTTVAVALVNNDTGVAVRVKYFDVQGGALPQLNEVVHLAIKLSSEPQVVAEATR